MDIDKEIEMAKKDLKDLKDRKKLNDQPVTEPKRSDKGKKRSPYKGTLPLRYRQYLNSANNRSLSFELSVKEFETICSYNCVYCGSSYKIGIDRKDSGSGYTIDNSQPCCTSCNMMKFKYSEEQFLQQVLKIYRHRLSY